MATVGELVVLALLWRKAGRHSPPPPEIAALPEVEQQSMYQQADDLVRARGEDYADALLETLTRHHHDRLA